MIQTLSEIAYTNKRVQCMILRAVDCEASDNPMRSTSRG